MGMHGAESIASSGVTQGHEILPLKDGVLSSENEQDDLLQTPSLEAGIFGVLFTLSQEKSQQHIRYHWILLKILLDSWQLYTTIIAPEMGWDIDPNGTIWKVVNVLSFQWLADLSYGWYVAGLYTITGLLAINLGLCVWVAWSFKEQKFDYVWPIKVVRGFSYVFLQVFDITSLNFLQLGISCNYVGPRKPHLHMALFPRYSCSTTPHIINAVLSGFLLVLFVAVAMLLNMSEVEVNPASKSPQALGHSGAEVTAFGIKALMTLVGVFLGWPTVAAVAYLLLAFWLAWVYMRWVPHLLTWVNCLKSGVALAMLVLAGLQVAVVTLAEGESGPQICSKLTIAMAISLGPAFLLGALIAWLRTKLFTSAVLNAFQAADPEAIKPQDVYHFHHPRDVEIASRSARVWVDLYTLEKTAVHRAEEIIKAGIALFPDDAYVAMVQADFMLDMLGFSQTGAKQLEAVRKLKPNIICRFMLFVRQQQATQKAASSTVGKGGNMDLLGYVEYQRKQRMVLRHHKDALQAMANFWRILGSSTVSFSSLSKSLEEIDTSVSQAETAYRVVLELYNNSPRLVRLYARFLETIKQDPWSAAEFHAAAERLEENKDEDGQGPTLPDGTPISRMDDVEKGVLVVNAFGDVQVANRKLHAMFGYKKGDLEGKNVTVLMPPHEAKRHPAILRRYIDSGDKAAPYFKHPVLALHRERVAFTVRIAVSRASGLGEDSVFIGILEALPTAPGLGRVWVTREGVIVCCDPGFVTCFGYHPEDIIGAQLDKLLRSDAYDADAARSADVWVANQANHDNQELVNRMLEAAVGYCGSVTSDMPAPPSMTASVLHKYDFAKQVTIDVRADVNKSPVFEVRMQLKSLEPQLLMVVERKGAIRHMSGDLAKILGVGLTDSLSGARVQNGGANGPGGTPQDAVMADDQVMLELMADELQRSLDDFLPAPWKIMHNKYRKYVNGGSSLLSGAWGCRSAVAQTSSSVGPTMRLVGLHGKPVYVHVAVSSREEDGEPVHVVRMARSSLETAIAERRLRLRVGEDGTVQELCLPDPTMATSDGGPLKSITELFGFPADQLVGCRLWDFMSLQQNSNGPGAQSVLPQRESIMDAPPEDPQQPGRSMDGSTRKTPPRSTPSRLSSQNLNLFTFDHMITNSLQTPGVSWRINVVPPSATAEAAAMGNPLRASAVLAQRTKSAVLRLDVALPSAMTAGATERGKLLIHAELWAEEAVTGVMEINASGRVTGILEEDIRPPGLLFGLPKDELMGAQLAKLLQFGPGQTAQGLLTESGVAKKSSLKSSSRKGKVVDKVGPVHYLAGFHRDNQPLRLAVQVLGKPGPGNPVTAIIRVASEKAFAAAQRSKKTPPAAAAGVAAASKTAAADGPVGRGALMFAADTSGARPSNAASFTSGQGAGLQLRLRESSFPGTTKPPTGMPTPMLKGASSFRQGGPGGPGGPGPGPGRSNDGRASFRELDTQLSIGSRAIPLQRREDSANLPGTPEQPPAMTSTLSASSLQALPLPRATSDTTAAAGAVAPPALPGAGALAAGVAGLLKTKTSAASTDVGAPGTPPGARGPAAPRAVGSDGHSGGDAASSGGGATGNPRNSPPLKLPESPEVAAGGSKRSLMSPRTAANLIPERQGRSPVAGAAQSEDDLAEPGDGDRDEDMSLENAIVALGARPGSDKILDSGLAGVDKWVATNGEFYRNKIASTDGMRRLGGDMDAEEEEDEDGSGGSAGATSRATSSHWGASPRPSASGLPSDMTEQPSFMSHQQQHRGGAGGMGGNGGGGGYPPYPGMAGKPQAGWVGGGAGAGGGGYGDDDMDVTVGRRPGGMAAALGAPPSPMGAAEGPPAQEDFPEDRSDGGESAVSGISGASGLSDQNTPADFKRGKRYRKLVKLMDSPQAQKAVVRLKINTALAVFAACAVHVVCFALIITAVRKQSDALDQLANAGGAQRYLQRALVDVRALDVAYQGRGSANTYNISHTQAFADDMMTFTTKYRNVHDRLLRDTGTSTEDLYYQSFIEVWSGYNVTTQQPYYENITLWDLVTRSFVSAKAIYQNHVGWHQQGLNISSMLPAAFLLNSGQDLILGMTQVVRNLLNVTVAHTSDVNVLQLTFLILEGCLVTSICAATLMYILRSACEQRYQLYETFLKIPVGLTKALASQTTHLLDDDESESEEDEDASQTKEAPDDASANPQGKRKLGFDDNPQASSHGAERSPLLGGGGGGRGGKHGDHGVGGGAPQLLSPARGVGGVGGGSKVLRVEDSFKGPGRGGSSRHTTLEGYKSTGQYALLLSTRDPAPKQQGFLGRIKAKIWRSGSIQPLPTGDVSRRTLEKDSKVSNHMMITLITYSFLIILFYSIAYATLLRVEHMVALQPVADYTSERTYRAVFYAQELAAEVNVSAVPDRVQGLRQSAISLRDAYYTLRMGGRASAAVGPHIEHFPLANGHGITKESASIFDLFYADNVCLRLAEHLPCPPSIYRFYEVSRAGLDGMMMQLLTEIKYLADEAEEAFYSGAPNSADMGSPRWDYIYNVGTVDLTDANLGVSSEHLSNIRRVFQTVLIMHVVLFLLLLGVFLCFLIFVYLPLLRRMTKEKRRIAEMMSQLPPELDVMKLVHQALMGPKSPAHIHRHPSVGKKGSMAHGSADDAAAAAAAAGVKKMLSSELILKPSGSGDGPGAGTDAAGGSGSKAYQQWKDILSRATSVQVAAAAANGGTTAPGNASKHLR